MWKAAVKSFLAHKFRFALTTLAVVLGVAFVTGTFVLTDTINRAFDTLFADVTRGVDVYVRAKAAFEGTTGQRTRPRVPERLVDRVRAIDGVALTEGEVTGYAQLVDKEGEAIGGQAPTFGVNWNETEGISATVIREGRPPRSSREAAVDASTARRHGFGVGDRVTVLFQGPPRKFTLVGIVGFGEADNLGGASLVAFDTATAQEVLGAEGRFDEVAVVGKEGVQPRVLRDRIASILPGRYEVATGEDVAAEQSQSIKDALGFLNTALLVFAAVALFMGAFMILNTFQILVTQRTRELGLLRALGAGRRQVMTLVVLEAGIVGAIASAVGLGFGVVLAVGLRALLAAFGLELPTTSLQVLPRTIVVALVVGLVVTVVAAIPPARRAARIPPVAALRETDSVRPVPLGRRSLAGGVVTAAGVAALLAGLFAGGGIVLVGLGVAVTFVGVAVLGPLLSRPVTRAIGAPAARLALPGKLGRENAMRNPRRTASTSSALMVGLALVATFLIMGASIKATVASAVERVFRADYVIAPTGGFATGFTPLVAEELRRLPEVATVSEVRIGEFREAGKKGTAFLSGVDPGTIADVMDLDVRAGDLGALSGNALFVHDNVAKDKRLAVGGTFRMEFPTVGVVPMRVAGVYRENGFIGDYLIPLSTYERNYRDQLDWRVMVNAAPGVSSRRARAAIEGRAKAHPNVQVLDQTELRKEQERLVNQLLGLISALLGLAILIALLGIMNTLALSVFERTRELGLLRAVGMSRRQVRAMIRWESVIIALLGGVIGVAVGAFFGWALVRALEDEGITDFALPGGQLAVFLALAGLAGVVAAVLPARRAARLDVLRAIAYE